MEFNFRLLAILGADQYRENKFLFSIVGDKESFMNELLKGETPFSALCFSNKIYWINKPR